jgi:hypothetical protein
MAPLGALFIFVIEAGLECGIDVQSHHKRDPLNFRMLAMVRSCLACIDSDQNVFSLRLRRPTNLSLSESIRLAAQLTFEAGCYLIECRKQRKSFAARKSGCEFTSSGTTIRTASHNFSHPRTNARNCDLVSGDAESTSLSCFLAKPKNSSTRMFR